IFRPTAHWGPIWNRSLLWMTVLGRPWLRKPQQQPPALEQLHCLRRPQHPTLSPAFSWRPPLTVFLESLTLVPRQAMRVLSVNLSVFPLLLTMPVLQMILVLVLPLLVAPVLVLIMTLVLVIALVEVLGLPLNLGIVQFVSVSLRSGPVLLQASEILGQIWCLIVLRTMGGLRNSHLGNVCKSQNLVPEGYGSPLRLKRSVNFFIKQCQGASVFSTTGRRRLPLPSPGEAIVDDEVTTIMRATNHLDQVPSMQDGSESYFFRHGHQGLLTLQSQSPMSFSTTHKDSYQFPRNHHQPIRGKREAMLEMLLHHQICKEVQAEQETTRKHVEVESVTHRDYKKELVQTGPPAPTKPHDYRQEQPETFWKQRASQLPVCEGDRVMVLGENKEKRLFFSGLVRGSVLILALFQGVSNIKTFDTPFRKNCSFSTPVPLSLGQPLPYEPEDFSYHLGEISSLVCQGGGLGSKGGRTTPT
ncbi:Sperm-associated antigen 8, partial [Galemys pyrenaicus]